MKKVFLGTFFAQDIILEDQETIYSEKEWQKMWSDCVEDTKRQAVREYKDSLFLKKAEGHLKELKKGFWYNLFKGNLK